eukprot:152781_1
MSTTKRDYNTLHSYASKAYKITKSSDQIRDWSKDTWNALKRLKVKNDMNNFERKFDEEIGKLNAILTEQQEQKKKKMERSTISRFLISKPNNKKIAKPIKKDKQEMDGSDDEKDDHKDNVSNTNNARAQQTKKVRRFSELSPQPQSHAPPEKKQKMMQTPQKNTASFNTKHMNGRMQWNPCWLIVLLFSLLFIWIVFVSLPTEVASPTVKGTTPKTTNHSHQSNQNSDKTRNHNENEEEDSDGLVRIDNITANYKMNHLNNSTRSHVPTQAAQHLIDSYHSHSYDNNQEFTAPFMQNTMDDLVKHISRHNYSTFNDDIVVNNITFHQYSGTRLVHTTTNRSLLLYGDSTMGKFTGFVLYCLHVYLKLKPQKFLDQNWNATERTCEFESRLTNDYQDMKGYINNGLFSGTSFDNTKSALITRIPMINCTFVSYERYAAGKQTPNTVEYMHYYENMFIKYRPNVIFWNPSSLHLLHLIPLRPFEHFNGVQTALDTNQHFDQHLRKIYEMGSRVNAQCIIYRSSSPICTAHDQSPYKELRQIYSNRSSEEYKSSIAQCYDKYKNYNKSLCDNWTFDDHGVQYVNKQIQTFVTQAQNGDFGNYTRVFYYDRYNLFHKDTNICKHESHDSVHWMYSYGADIMLFTNFVDFVCRKT